MKRCHRCGTPWESEKKQPGPKEFCESCSAYLHCCMNCRYYEPGAHNDCYIGTTEWVGDKAGANYCDEFEFADADAPRGKDDRSRGARDALDRLFGGSGPADDEGRDAFDRLFGD